MMQQALLRHLRPSPAAGGGVAIPPWSLERADGGLADEVVGGEQQIGGSGGSLEPWASFLNPLGLFLRTSIPFVWRFLSAFLRA